MTDDRSMFSVEQLDEMHQVFSINAVTSNQQKQLKDQPLHH